MRTNFLRTCAIIVSCTSCTGIPSVIIETEKIAAFVYKDMLTKTVAEDSVTLTISSSPKVPPLQWNELGYCEGVAYSAADHKVKLAI